MSNYLDRMPPNFCLFDTPLVYNFSEASTTVEADLTKIFADTLVAAKPVNAVTLVQNHDTQPGQALYIRLEDWFKPLAYALILLRRSGYPVVFYGDLYGISGPDEFRGPSCKGKLPDLILARKLYAYGDDSGYRYFNYRTCIGWVRYGTWDHPDGCAVVLSNAGPGWKDMDVGKKHKGEIWTDVVRSFYFSIDCSWVGRTRKSRLVRMESGALNAALVPSACTSGKRPKKGSYLGICNNPFYCKADHT